MRHFPRLAIILSWSDGDPGPQEDGSFLVDTTEVGWEAMAGDVERVIAEFTIQNGGPGNWAGPVLTINYEDGSGWLRLVTQRNGDLITGTLYGNPSALSADVYEGSVTIEDAKSSNSPLVITVAGTITEPAGTISAFPSELVFSAVAGGAAVATTTISNVSPLGELATPTAETGNVVYGPGASDWITGLSITGDGPWQLQATAEPDLALAPGTYTAQVPVASDGATNTPFLLAAQMTVTASQSVQLRLDRSIDDIKTTIGGPNPPTQVVGLQGIGGSLANPHIKSITYSGVSTGWASTSQIIGNALHGTGITELLDQEGVSLAFIEVDADNAVAPETYTLYLSMGAGAPPAALGLSPSGFSIPAVQGVNPQPTTIQVQNVGSGGLAGLGTVTVEFAVATPWASLSYNAASGLILFTPNTSTYDPQVLATQIRVTASNAVNSPVLATGTVTITAQPVEGQWPRPPLDKADIPRGYLWGDTEGYPIGSCFEDGIHPGGYTAARPDFDGTVYRVPQDYTKAQIQTMLGNGTIVSGDIVRIQAGTSIDKLQLPKRPGWEMGDGFVCIQSSEMDELPPYSFEDGPLSYGLANRVGPQHMPYLASIRTPHNNISPILPQQGAGGYWIEGCYLWIDNVTWSPPRSNQCVSLGAHAGESPATQTQISHIPCDLVIDRCLVHGSGDYAKAIIAHSRYTRITHSTLGPARISLTSTPSTNYECQAICGWNTDGKIDILGNQMSGWGEHILWGGANPGVTNIVPADIAIMWNMMLNPSSAMDPDVADSDDFKNAMENKTGRRIFWAFNNVDGMPWRTDQRYAINTKATDQGGSGNYAAHVTDQYFWCNSFRGSKGLATIIDVFSGGGPGAAIGSERLVFMWNRHEYLTDQWPTKYLAQKLPQNMMPINIVASNGDGIPGVTIQHNTYGGRQSVLDLGSGAAKPSWRDVDFSYNVHLDIPNDGPVRSSQSASDVNALNIAFGAGNWRCAYNYTYSGGAQWDAAMLGGSNQNGYHPSASPAGNFVDPANRNFALLTGHPGKGVGLDGRDAGYDHDYLVAMTGTVQPNPE